MVVERRVNAERESVRIKNGVDKATSHIKNTSSISEVVAKRNTQVRKESNQLFLLGVCNNRVFRSGEEEAMASAMEAIILNWI